MHDVWSSTGYVAAAWTAALDVGATNAFLGGTNAYAMGATPWQTAQAAYTGGRNGFLGGMIAGPAMHGAGQLVGASWRYGKSFFANTADEATNAAARRAYLNAKFGRTGNLHADINARGLGIGSMLPNATPALYWHGTEAAVDGATAEGLFAHGPGSGGKYWATTQSSRNRITVTLQPSEVSHC